MSQPSAVPTKIAVHFSKFREASYLALLERSVLRVSLRRSTSTHSPLHIARISSMLPAPAFHNVD